MKTFLSFAGLIADLCRAAFRETDLVFEFHQIRSILAEGSSSIH